MQHFLGHRPIRFHQMQLIWLQQFEALKREERVQNLRAGSKIATLKKANVTSCFSSMKPNFFKTASMASLTPCKDSGPWVHPSKMLNIRGLQDCFSFNSFRFWTHRFHLKKHKPTEDKTLEFGSHPPIACWAQSPASHVLINVANSCKWSEHHDIRKRCLRLFRFMCFKTSSTIGIWVSCVKNDMNTSKLCNHHSEQSSHPALKSKVVCIWGGGCMLNTPTGFTPFWRHGRFPFQAIQKLVPASFPSCMLLAPDKFPGVFPKTCNICEPRSLEHCFSTIVQCMTQADQMNSIWKQHFQTSNCSGHNPRTVCDECMHVVRPEATENIAKNNSCKLKQTGCQQLKGRRSRL